ncbi:MAG: hypothetical protein HY211_07300 [Candidatus Omnitrophica bacterium]|nr:hypothetical protein [Candidatus Omnitrophota bacterium]
MAERIRPTAAAGMEEAQDPQVRELLEWLRTGTPETVKQAALRLGEWLIHPLLKGKEEWERFLKVADPMIHETSGGFSAAETLQMVSVFLEESPKNIDGIGSGYRRFSALIRLARVEKVKIRAIPKVQQILEGWLHLTSDFFPVVQSSIPLLLLVIFLEKLGIDQMPPGMSREEQQFQIDLFLKNIENSIDSWHQLMDEFLKVAVLMESSLDLESGGSNAAGLEEEKFRELDRAVVDGLNALRAPGEWIEDMVQRAIRRALRFFPPEQEVLAGEVLDITDSRKLPWIVYEVPGSPEQRELHFHYPLIAPESWPALGGQLRLNSSGQVQSPLWLEASSIYPDYRGIYHELPLIQTAIPLGDLPEGFLDHLDQALQKALGGSWRDVVLKTEPKGRFFSTEPLFSNPETWQLFLQRVKQSPKIQEILRGREWGQRFGRGIRTGDYERHGFPLVTTGQLRQVLSTQRLLEDTPDQRTVYFKGFQQERSYFPSDLVLMLKKEGQAVAYFNRGFLLIKPNASFLGRESLLEEIFLWGAELSQELDRRLHESATWPPPTLPSLAGLEERRLEQPELVLEKYAGSLAALPEGRQERVRDWLSRRNVRVTEISLPDVITLYVRGGPRFFEEVQRFLKQPEGIRFELKRLPLFPGQRWEEMGLILNDKGLGDYVEENPRALPVHDLYFVEIWKLDPALLLARIFASLPVGSQFLGAELVTDSQGKARLILFSA